MDDEPDQNAASCETIGTPSWQNSGPISVANARASCSETPKRDCAPGTTLLEWKTRRQGFVRQALDASRQSAKRTAGAVK
jgi:hypothetical protein